MKKYYLLNSVFGILLVDSTGKVIEKYEYGTDPLEVASLIEEIKGGKPPDTVIKFIQSLERIDSEIIFDDLSIKNILAQHNLERFKYEPLDRNIKRLRQNKDLFLNVFGISQKDYLEHKQAIAKHLVQRKLTEKLSERGMFVVHSIRYLDVLDNFLNNLIMALREWYGLYFPELVDTLDDHVLVAELIYRICLKDEYTMENLKKAGLGSKKAAMIAKLAAESAGGSYTAEDLAMIRKIAGYWIQLSKLRFELEERIKASMKEIAPNLSTIINPLVAARLIAEAGGLDRLSSLPASSIQVLGAQKALFAHLQGKGPPPKHGVIFQVKDIRNSSKKIRGKIARLYASKIAIASRVDYFKGEFIGDKLKMDLEKKIKELREKYGKGKEGSKV